MLDYNVLAEDYARYRRAHPEVLRELLAAGGLRNDSRALEVGCGTGNYIIAMQQATGCAAWGVDPSDQMLAQAMSRTSAVRFAFGRAEQLGFDDDSFDLVFSVDVIHHVKDRVTFLAQAFRILAPGGFLCTVTDSEWIIRNRVPLSHYFPDTIEPELQRYPRIDVLLDTMRQAGFGQLREAMVEFTYELSDLSAYRAKTYSALHLIPEEAFQRGIAALEADLRRAPIRCVSRYALVWGMKTAAPNKR